MRHEWWRADGSAQTRRAGAVVDRGWSANGRSLEEWRLLAKGESAGVFVVNVAIDVQREVVVRVVLDMIVASVHEDALPSLW